MFIQDLLQMHNRFETCSAGNNNTLDNVLRILNVHNFSPTALRYQIDFNKFSICAAISISLFSTPVHEHLILEKCLQKLKELLAAQKVKPFPLIIIFKKKRSKIYRIYP